MLKSLPRMLTSYLTILNFLTIPWLYFYILLYSALFTSSTNCVLQELMLQSKFDRIIMKYPLSPILMLLLARCWVLIISWHPRCVFLCVICIFLVGVRLCLFHSFHYPNAYGGFWGAVVRNLYLVSDYKEPVSDWH